MEEKPSISSEQADVIKETLPALLHQRGRGEENDNSALFVKTKLEEEKLYGVEWEATTWKQYAYRVKRVAKGLISLGIGKGTKVVILGQAKPETLYFFMGCMSVGVVPVLVYPTYSAAELEKVINHSTAELAFALSSEQLKKMVSAAPGCPQLQTIVYHTRFTLDKGLLDSGGPFLIALKQLEHLSSKVSDSQFLERLNGVDPNDLAAITYNASVTADRPETTEEKRKEEKWNLRGVMLSHSNLLFTAKALKDVMNVSELDAFLSFLPLNHPLQQMLTVYIPILTGCQVYFNGGKTKRLLSHLERVQPTHLFAPAFFWKKIYSAVKRSAERILLESLAEGLDEEEVTKKLFDREVGGFYHQSKREIGCTRLKMASSGLSSLPSEVAAFMKDELDVNITECYASPECSGVIACGTAACSMAGSMLVLPGVQVKIDESGGNEILVSGSNVFMGYWQDEEATNKILEGGWLRTGDIGDLDDNGFISIQSRKKEIVTLKSGEKINPVKIENLLKEEPLICHALVLGDQREYLTAVINPVKMSSKQRRTAVKAIQEHIAAINRKVDRHQRVRKVKISTKSFSLKEGHINHAGNLRRNFLIHRFSKEISEMYEGETTTPTTTETETTTSETTTTTEQTQQEQPKENETQPRDESENVSAGSEFRDKPEELSVILSLSSSSVLELRGGEDKKPEKEKEEPQIEKQPEIEVKEEKAQEAAVQQQEESNKVEGEIKIEKEPETEVKETVQEEVETKEEHKADEKDNETNDDEEMKKEIAMIAAEIMGEETKMERQKEGDSDEDEEQMELDGGKLDEEEAALDRWIAQQEKRMKALSQDEGNKKKDKREKEDDSSSSSDSDDDEKEKKRSARKEEQEKKRAEQDRKKAERDEGLEKLMEEKRKKRDEEERRRNERIQEELRLREEEEKKIQAAVEQADREQLLRQIKELHNKLRYEQEELAAALSKEEDTRRKLEEVEMRAKESKKSAEKKAQKKRDVQKQLAKLKQQILNEEENLEEERIRVAMVNKEKDRLIKEIEDLELSKQRTEKELLNVTDLLALEEKDKKRLEKDNQHLVEQLKAIDKLREKISRNKKIIASLVKNEDRLKEQLKEMQRQREMALADKSRYERVHDKMERETKDLRAKIEEELRNKMSLEDAKRRLEAKVRELTDLLDEEAEANRNLRKENRKLSRDLRFKSQQANGSWEAKSDAGTVRMLQSELNLLKEKMTALTEERDILSRKLIAARTLAPALNIEDEDDEDEGKLMKSRKREERKKKDDFDLDGISSDEDDEEGKVGEEERLALLAKAKKILEESSDSEDDIKALEEEKGKKKASKSLSSSSSSDDDDLDKDY